MGAGQSNCLVNRRCRLAAALPLVVGTPASLSQAPASISNASPGSCEHSIVKTAEARSVFTPTLAGKPLHTGLSSSRRPQAQQGPTLAHSTSGGSSQAASAAGPSFSRRSRLAGSRGPRWAQSCCVAQGAGAGGWGEQGRGPRLPPDCSPPLQAPRLPPPPAARADQAPHLPTLPCTALPPGPADGA